MRTDLMPHVPPAGDVFFPLASNAHALVTGGGVASVRARIKMASLLYDRVLLEAGIAIIQAGLHGTFTARPRGRPDQPAEWQTPLGRKRGQDSPISIAVAPEAEPGIPADGAYTTIINSPTSIYWLPTLEPFVRELSGQCDWIVLGEPADMAEPFKDLKRRWTRRDDSNTALERLVPERFVRERLVEHVSHDLAIGASGGWDVSVDRYHGRVITARFAEDASIRVHGFALPVLVPRVADLGWSEIIQIRNSPGIKRLRQVIREVETEAFEVARAGGDLDSALHAAYRGRLIDACCKVEGLRSAGMMGVAELLVGAGAGYATTGLALLGPLAGAGASAAAMTGWHISRTIRGHGRRAWIGIMESMAGAAV